MNEIKAKNKRLNIIRSVDTLKISQEIPYKNVIFISFVINVAVIGFILLIRKNHLPPVVPLYYGLPEGESQIVPVVNLTFPSIIALVIIAINTLITSLLKDDFLKKTLIIASLAATFFSVITIIKIAFLVGSF
jgi:hypothetical protein